MEITRYSLPPTRLIPNSPLPLMHYRFENALGPKVFQQLCDSNDWTVQWIYRYGDTQRSHYHSGAHECMAVLSGTATIRFGVGDTSLDMQDNTYGPAREAGGVEIEARAGDVFVLPAGTAHKTHKTNPKAEFRLMTPGDGHGIPEGTDLDKIELDGFTMVGAYPKGSKFWDSIKGDEQDGPAFANVWSMQRPAKDPVLGYSPQGLAGAWATRLIPKL